MKRRDFVRSGVAGIAGGVIGTPSMLAAGSSSSIPRGGSSDLPVRRARNIIFFAYDGFNHEDLGTARYFAQRHLGMDRLAIEELLATGASGVSLTHSADSAVTDSAAASSAWASGVKLLNGRIGVDAEGDALTLIMELARRQGRATGLITTARLTHATPAGWVASVVDRNNEDTIASQYLDFAPDVLLGGGARHFDSATRSDGRDLFAEFRAAGYEVLRSTGDLARSNASRVMGAFTQGHLPFEIDRRYQSADAPSLADLTTRGLNVLDGADNGFVVQIEAGRIDHANHDNDPAAMVWDVLAADEALRVAMAYVDRTPGTLMIMASDHGTGGGAIYGSGTRYSETDRVFDGLARRRASQEHLLGVLGRRPDAAALQAAVGSVLGVQISPAEALRAVEVLERRQEVLHHPGSGGDRSTMLHLLLTQRDEDGRLRLNFNYATGAHTAGPVPVALYGNGVTGAGLGVVDNTELFHWMTHALGIERSSGADRVAPGYALAG